MLLFLKKLRGQVALSPFALLVPTALTLVFDDDGDAGKKLPLNHGFMRPR